MSRVEAIREEFIRIMREDAHAQSWSLRMLTVTLFLPTVLVPLALWLTDSLLLGGLAYLAGASLMFAWGYAIAPQMENIARYPGFISFCRFLSEEELRECLHFLESRRGRGVARYHDVLDFISSLPVR
jgi:hypothetical protein